MSETNPAVSIEDINPIKKKMSFEVPWALMKREMDGLYREIAKTAKVRGFRPGKVPRHILESMYRKVVEEEAAGNLIERHYWESVKEHDLKPLGMPEVVPGKIIAEQPFIFSATFEVEPTVEPKDYLCLDLEKPDETATDADVEERLLLIRDTYSTLEDVDVDREVENGDFVVIDFKGFVGGMEDDRMKAEEYLLEIGARSFIPSFEDALVGMRKGQTKEFDVTFPEDYHHATMAGKEVRFQVSLKAIKEKKLPPLDEEFIKNFDTFNTVEDLRNDVRRRLEEEYRRRSENLLREQIADKLLTANVFEVPMVMVEAQARTMKEDFRQRLIRQGQRPQAIQAFLEGADGDFRKDAERFVRLYYLVKAIASREGIVVDDAEVEEYIKKMAEQRGQDGEALIGKYREDGTYEELRSDLLHKKVYKYLQEKGTVTIVPRV